MAFLESRGKHNKGTAAAGSEARLPAAEVLAQRGRKQAAGERGFPTSQAIHLTPEKLERVSNHGLQRGRLPQKPS